MMATSDDDADERILRSADANADDRVRVLILGGWSPGPLDYIRDRFATECVFFEPALHMPPVGINWCCTWQSALLAAALYCAWYFASRSLVAVLVALAACPLIIILLVRGSIRRSIAAAEAVIVAQSIDVVVGFSWGGAIGCFLMRRPWLPLSFTMRKQTSSGWARPTLLLAPTLHAMESAACLPARDPFFNARRSDQRPQRPAHRDVIDVPNVLTEKDLHQMRDCEVIAVHVFHATHDGFCPESQRSAFELTGATVHVCRDGHTLDMPETLEKVAAVFAELLELAATLANTQPHRRSSAASGHLLQVRGRGASVRPPLVPTWLTSY